MTDGSERLVVEVSEHKEGEPHEHYRAEWPGGDSRFFGTGESRREAVRDFLTTQIDREVEERCEPVGGDPR